jgi:hypothetical protein
VSLDPSDFAFTNFALPESGILAVGSEVINEGRVPFWPGVSAALAPDKKENLQSASQVGTWNQQLYIKSRGCC